MEYLLFIVNDPAAPPYVPEEDDIEDWAADLERRNANRVGNRLRPPSDATTVTVRDGRTILTDGPFTETKEWIAGFDLIDVADLDEAIEIASRHPMARFGRVEVRPVWPME
ncbi:YciI family protein [Microbacterium hydrocarbonoxydans]|uniref:YciI family protein n=1 Tax=Microbacterium hydrocarbonoxydans TaxID=273678 RepID=UPI0020422CC5|nr:YciI family protein [Microbacterium hydrocarbonoxydans]MCM3781300.1 YciI family protein [Microbacterium hydrocarbonoxydans]